MLDTNICIYIIKRKPTYVYEKFRNMEPDSVGVSSITVAELQYGVSRSTFFEKNHTALLQFLIPLTILDFNSQAAAYYGQLRNRLERKGTPIGPMDTLIAAHALSIDVTLITNNLKEFTRVEGLRAENWIL